MALTQGQQHLWLQSWALPPPSFLRYCFLLCCLLPTSGSGQALARPQLVIQQSSMYEVEVVSTAYPSKLFTPTGPKSRLPEIQAQRAPGTGRDA